MLQGQVISLGIRLGRGLVLILYIGQLLIAVRKDLKQYIVPYFRAARYDEPSPVSSYSTASQLRLYQRAGTETGPPNLNQFQPSGFQDLPESILRPFFASHN